MLRRYIPAAVALALVTWWRVHLVDALPDQGYFAKYLTFADAIVSGHMPRARLTDLSPGYLWFIVALRWLGASMHTIRTLQIAMVSLAAFFCGFAARRFGPVAAIAAPLLLLGSRGALVCATEAEPETLILLLTSAALAAMSGLLFGAAAICRPVALLMAAAAAIAQRSWRMIALAIVPVIAIAAVNYALAGDAVVMDPGTVFYEGMNPSATGYAGVQPAIVNEMERGSREPDYLHVAYRIVASHAEGRPLTRAESNAYWTGKALTFARSYPFAALRLTSRKLLFALHSHEAWDLATMARKDLLLARLPFIPFGLLVALAGAAVLLMAGRRDELAPYVWFTFAGLVVLAAFYVTARQRNALLPPLVILGGAGVAELVARRRVVATLVAGVAAALLTIDGPYQREDTNGWLRVATPFDAALSLEAQGKWADADRILEQLDAAGYVPLRENRAVPSIAFYRARAAAHLGRDPRSLLDRAASDAPGNEHVLAARARLGDEDAERLLFALHDPVTAQRALAER